MLIERGAVKIIVISHYPHLDNALSMRARLVSILQARSHSGCDETATRLRQGCDKATTRLTVGGSVAM